VQLRFSDDVAIVSLTGKFIAGSDAPFLRQKVSELIEAGSRRLAINLEHVPYIDSTGIGFLVATHELAQQAGATVVLVGVNRHVKKVLDEVKLSQFFDIANDETSAIRQLKQADLASGTSRSSILRTKPGESGMKSPQ